MSLKATSADANSVEVDREGCLPMRAGRSNSVEVIEMVETSVDDESDLSSVAATSRGAEPSTAVPSTATLHSSTNSLPGLSSSLTHLVPSSAVTSMDGLSYNCHENNVLSVKDLHYEVTNRGMEWWQALSSFQLPWRCLREGSSECYGCSKAVEGEGHRVILKGVNFEVQSGEMLAVLGSSGSGKTSLLDVISCNYESGDVRGEVYINGEPRTVDVIKQCSASVRQDDRLLPHLTVRETLNFVAQLKLPSSWSLHDIRLRVCYSDVDNVIAELGLRHVADSKVGGEEIRGISGGERRRVSIGVQLLLDPSILFLDEPTSGLDSFTAHHLMETLAKLARNNRIVMLSIHQPRSDIFALFDLTMLLSQGHMVYYGKAANMVDYFTTLGHPCPELTNPCDFYVDLTTVDMKTSESERETMARVQQLVANFNDHMAQTSTDKPADMRHVTPKPSPSPQNGLVAFKGSGTDPVTGFVNLGMSLQDEDGLTKSVGRDDVPDEVMVEVSEVTQRSRQRAQSIRISSSLPSELDKPGVGKQFTVLLRRSLKNNFEDYGFLSVQAVEALAMSLIIGLVYFDLQLDQLSARDRFGLLYIIGALYPYMVILDVIGKYYKERFTIYFEMKDGLYQPGAYFWAKIVSEIPEHTVFIILYSVPVYFLSGMQLKVGHFFQAFGIVFIMVFCSRCLGQFAGALLPTYQMAVLFAQSLFTFFLLSSGFIFNLENLFIGMKWTNHISYLKWGYQSLCLTEFPGLNFTCPDLLPEVCINDGQEALRAYSLNGAPLWHGIAIICAEIVILTALFYIAVKFVSQKPHQT